jgi:photosystem II stability/assembly factor-like uncharacterized protein
MFLMQQDSPDVAAVKASFDSWYATRPFKKNRYTQYYKHWMRWVQTPPAAPARKPGNQADGPTNASNWTFVGPKQTYDTDGLQEVTWQTNIYSIDISVSNPSVLYAGGETGGVWKTTNKGLNWTLLTKNITHNSFGAVKIHPTNPDTVYACTSGKIIKTTNGGNSWTTVYTESNLWGNDIYINTANPNIVIVAADQGLLRSTNGGANWTKLNTNKTWTVEAKVGTPNTVYAVQKSGSSSNFRISTDAGATWTNSNTGWWSPGAGETMTGAHIAICPSNANKIYAYLCGEGAIGNDNLIGYVGVFKSTDGGATWSNTNPANAIGNSPTAYSIPAHTNLMTNNGLASGFDQGFYDMAIIVNPNNEDQLIAGGTSWFKSTDGGATWNGLGGYVGSLNWSHPDIQALAVSGNDLWIASDGGLDYSADFGGSIAARMNGISGADLWGFDSGWNEDVLVGGRYHNGNMAFHESFPAGKFYRMGGAESPTGYVNPGENRKTYFSDIGGYRLKGGFNDDVSPFAVAKFPNESYAYYANSEMVWDPRCWNIVYIGNENKIWKSTDGGASFSVLYTFPGAVDKEVYEIEVCRSNPDVIYCSQWTSPDDAMWKSTDGGVSWTALTALPLPNNNDRVKMAVSGENENILWVSVSYGSDGKKVYKSTNGGTTWTNLTTATLNGYTITNIMAQYGTDGGVYIGTNGGVFYRNNSHSDWQLFSTELPMSAETNRLKPFYRDGKIRNGTWGHGVWESPLFETSQVSAQPITSALLSKCTRDTVYFDDYSVVNHSGATWSWAFSPAPSYVSSTTVRNPKVVFGAVGTYTATMTLNGTYQKSLTISVTDGCQADTIPGYKAALKGNTDEDYVSIPPLGLNTNTMTVTAWIKITGTQTDYSSIFMHDGASAGFNFRPGSNRLGYHWPNGQWSWDSGPIVPTGKWTHVAMVVEPTGVTLYVNGKGVKQSFTVPAVDFSDGSRLGSYKGWGGRYMNGDIDEVCIFSSALSQNQIRELMHLTKTPSEWPTLHAYYQFNEADGAVLDRVGARHAALGGTATRSNSSAPVGKGSSTRLNVTSGGAYSFGNTGVTLTFPNSGPYPNGELCVSRINQNPDQLPNALPHSTGYWIVNNYGTNTTFNTLTSLSLGGYGNIPAGSTPNAYRLYKRGSFDDGNSWGTAIDGGDAVTAGTNGSVLFSTGNGVNAFSQFFVNFDPALPVEWSDFQVALEDNARVRLYWTVHQGNDLSHFVVERSTDAVDFKEIGTVEASKGSGLRNYDTVDSKPHAGTNYYRIREVSKDGGRHYSALRSVTLDALAQDWAVYPNPLPAGQALHVATNREGEYRIRLYNAAGKMVLDRFGSGHADIPLDLPKGAYTYHILDAAHNRGGRLVIR